MVFCFFVTSDFENNSISSNVVAAFTSVCLTMAFNDVSSVFLVFVVCHSDNWKLVYVLGYFFVSKIIVDVLSRLSFVYQCFLVAGASWLRLSK